MSKVLINVNLCFMLNALAELCAIHVNALFEFVAKETKGSLVSASIYAVAQLVN